MKPILYTFISRDGLSIEKHRLGKRTFFPPAPWRATVSRGSGVVLTITPAPESPSIFRRVIDSRLARFLLFLAIIGGFTVVLTLSSHALFNVILALGVASVVSAAWKFSA
jgi:hypothetical protein